MTLPVGTGGASQDRNRPPGAAEREAREPLIAKKHRMVYRIFETEVYVDILAAYGHYDDK